MEDTDERRLQEIPHQLTGTLVARHKSRGIWPFHKKDRWMELRTDCALKRTIRLNDSPADCRFPQGTHVMAIFCPRAIEEAERTSTPIEPQVMYRTA